MTVPLPAPHICTVSGYVLGMKLAIAFATMFIVTVHGLVPRQAPDQPQKTDFALGVAVSVTGCAAAGAVLSMIALQPDELPVVQSMTLV